MFLAVLRTAATHTTQILARASYLRLLRNSLAPPLTPLSLPGDHLLSAAAIRLRAIPPAVLQLAQIIDVAHWGSVGESGFLQVKIQCWPRLNKRVQQVIETEVELFP